jgi:hypothetical protein
VKYEIKKQKKKKIQDVVEVVPSNTFASVVEVSEENLKELLVPIFCLCIGNKNQFNSDFRELKRTNLISTATSNGSLSE